MVLCHQSQMFIKISCSLLMYKTKSWHLRWGRATSPWTIGFRPPGTVSTSPHPSLQGELSTITAWGCQAWRGCIIDGKLLYLCEDFSMITERSGIYSCQQNSVSFQHEPVRQTPSCSCNWIVRAFYCIHGNPENSSNG